MRFEKEIQTYPMSKFMNYGFRENCLLLRVISNRQTFCKDACLKNDLICFGNSGFQMTSMLNHLIFEAGPGKIPNVDTQ
ncbi:hypothetical protein BA6E_10181 [Bacteroidales bacterium 6E]|nr:hypothetical protein BA6E_10181 [Bacteroidales bacterium 6E]